MPVNERDGVVYKQPKKEEERAKVAGECQKGLKLSMPMLIDGMDNKVNEAYTAWPDRLYIVGKDGKVAYKGGPGPGGFNPREMEQALARVLNE
jgi:type I thyroxine 5'-deiodinase